MKTFVFAMTLKPMLFLAVAFLPTLVAFTIKFDNNQIAEYELLKVTDNIEFLSGGRAFVRFAKVVSSPAGFVFQKGAEVAVKIAFQESADDMTSEQKALDYVRTKDPGGNIGVVKGEKYKGVSLDLHKEVHLMHPEGLAGEEHLSVIIMERLGMDLGAMFVTRNGFTDQEIETIYDQLFDILGKLRAIGFSHGDVKPQNILFRSNNIKDGICLADVGFAVFEGTDLDECGGDSLMMSPIQDLLDRTATCDDSEFSGAISILYVAKTYLPWLMFIEDLSLREDLRRFDNHRGRGLVSKYEFIQAPFAKYPRVSLPSSSLREKIKETIKRTTEHEVLKIQEKINKLKELLLPEKTGCKIPCTLL